MNPNYSHIIQSVQVNIPFTMLVDDYLERFLEYRLNPEIGLDAAALDRFSRADFQPLLEYLTANKTAPPIITLEPHTEENLWDSLAFLDNIWPYQ